MHCGASGSKQCRDPGGGTRQGFGGVLLTCGTSYVALSRQWRRGHQEAVEGPGQADRADPRIAAAKVGLPLRDAVQKLSVRTSIDCGNTPWAYIHVQEQRDEGTHGGIAGISGNGERGRGRAGVSGNREGVRRDSEGGGENDGTG
jgi:hypothetical protein